MYKPAIFIIDSIPGVEFPGYTEGDNWNGWACPYFEKKEAERVLHLSEANGFAWRFIVEADAFEVVFGEGSENEEIVSFQGTTITVGDRETRVYPIGAYSWIWELSEAAEP